MLLDLSVLIGKNLKFELTEDNVEYKLALYMYENPLILLPRYKSEIHLSAVISLIKQIVGINILPDKAYFQHSKVQIMDEYIKLFGESLYFDAHENALFFSKEKLNIPLKNSYPGLLKYFETQAEKIIEDLY